MSIIRYTQKNLSTTYGKVTVSTPRNCNSSFDSQFIKKCETILAEGVAKPEGNDR